MLIETAPAVTVKLSVTKLAKPKIPVVAVGIAEVVTAVTKPFALTVIKGIVVEVPKLPTLALTVASVSAFDTSAEPLKLTDQVASPVVAILRAVAKMLELSALPIKLP